MVDWQQNPKYLQWAGARLGFTYDPAQCWWLTSITKAGSVRGVVIFSRFHVGGCEISAVGGPGWVTKEMMFAVAGYVWFQDGGMKRVTAIIAEGNEKSLNLAEQLGFQVEGHLRNWFPSGDAKILGLLREDCKIYRILSGLTFRTPGTRSVRHRAGAERV